MSEEPWQLMDDWCARQSQKLLDDSNQQILAGVKLDDPQYRCLLGQSQAFGRMRSFIHTARNDKALSTHPDKGGE